MADQDGAAAPSNVGEFTVSELSLALKRTVEEAFGLVRVRGEISGYRGPHSSGHAYFSLKDDRSRLEAVIWRPTMSRLRHRPEEGMEVIATGRLTTYPGSSKYQIVIENIEPAGVGALMALLEERKKRLAAEGLFDAGRKQLLPYLPRVIGVVTSPTGAVIRDVLHRLADRYPLHVLVWPVRVQGETTGAEVSAAIAGFNALAPQGRIPRPDLIIVARGGGSVEDLWGFNDEAVVRAAAASEIPLISAIGHETDWTLLDLVADLRAPTPTGAAELAVPVKAELEALVATLGARLRSGLSRNLETARSGLRAAARALGTPEDILAAPRQRLDVATGKLGTGLQLAVRKKESAFGRIAGRMGPALLERHLNRARDRLRFAGRQGAAALAARANHARSRFDGLARRLEPGKLERLLVTARSRLDQDWRLLQNLGHRQVLSRGFALVRDAAGRPVTRAAMVQAGDAFSVEMQDGRIAGIASGGDGPTSRPKTATARKPPGGQGNLF